jgi:hypothetical protein
MSENQVLREGIRNGTIVCYCPIKDGQRQHHIACEWNNAVTRIYEIERAPSSLRDLRS